MSYFKKGRLKIFRIFVNNIPNNMTTFCLHFTRIFLKKKLIISKIDFEA